MPSSLRASIAALLLLTWAVGCRDNPPTAPASSSSTKDALAYNPDWTAASHGKDASPNYAVAFPQAAVNTIEITMTAAQWASIRANMVSLWGTDFGVRRTGGGGAFPSVEPSYVDVTLKFNGKTWKNVGFRLKGNSSLSSAWGAGNYKLPFRLKLDEFEDKVPAIDDQRFFGFQELSMSPGFADASLIREKLTSDVLRMGGIPAARTAFYRVFIDFGAGLKYCGVYTMVEVIDDTMVKNQFGDDAGNIYKPESRFQTFVQTQFEKKNNEAAPSYADVQALITALNNPLRTTNAAAWRAGLEATLDVDHFLKWLAVNNAIVNWDTYGAIAHNYYLYNHPTRKLVWIPWDHNQSMAGSPGLTGAATTPGTPGGGGGGMMQGSSLTMNEVATTWPLIRYLADDPTYFARYKAHMKAFNESVFSQATLNGMIDTYTALITPHVVGANGEQPGHTHLTSQAAFTAAASALKTHVQARKTLVGTFAP